LVFALAVAAVQGADYRFIGRRSTPGNDIKCGQKDSDGKLQPFCKICDGVPAVVEACNSNPECRGFDMDGGYCGYLKGAAGQGKTVYTEGYGHYCKLNAGSSCAGDFIVKIRADVQGKDVDCNAKNYEGKRLSYCEVSGYPLDVAAACSSNPSCKAFTTTSTSGGYLKTASGPTSYTEGATVYVKA